jgi:hypothetical protein
VPSNDGATHISWALQPASDGCVLFQDGCLGSPKMPESACRKFARQDRSTSTNESSVMLCLAEVAFARLAKSRKRGENSALLMLMISLIATVTSAGFHFPSPS